MLSPELLALGAAGAIAVGSVLMKQGLQSSTRKTVVFVTVGVQGIVFVALTVVSGSNIDFANPSSVVPFVVTGILGSILARFLIATSVDVVGLARAMPVRTTSPVFSAVVAILLFGERFSLAIGAGTGLVVCGLAVLTYDAYSSQDDTTPDGETSLVYLIPVFVASLLLGLTPSLRKFGLDAGTSVYGGLALNFSTAFLIFGTYYLARYRSEFVLGLGVFRFVGTGLFWSLGFWMYFTALQSAETVIVVPLFTTTPLFVIVLSWLFLDNVEEVTAGLVLGAVGAVLGAVLVIVG